MNREIKNPGFGSSLSAILLGIVALNLLSCGQNSDSYHLQQDQMLSRVQERSTSDSSNSSQPDFSTPGEIGVSPLPVQDQQDFGWGSAESLPSDYPENTSDDFMSQYLLGKRGALVGQPECRRETLRALLRAASQPQEQARVAALFLQKCESSLRQSAVKVPGKTEDVQYRYWEDSRFHLYRFQGADGFRVRGLLGLQETQRPLPLMIVKLGTMSDITHPATSLYLSYLFDGIAFHVLILESATSDRAILDNREIALGGLIEGVNTYQIAQFVRSRHFEWSERFSETHLLGVSLGGHSSLYTSLYDNHQSQILGTEPLFRSSLAMCPAVDLKPAVESMFSSGSVMGRIRGFFFMRWLEKLFKNDPSLKHHLFEHDLPGKTVTVSTGIARAATRYARGWLNLNQSMEPFRDIRIQHEVDFWKYNQLSNWTETINFETPLLGWHAENDPVVSIRHGLNALQEFEERRQLAHGVPNDLNKGLMSSRLGGHCRFSFDYGWDIEATVAQEFLLEQSQRVQRELIEPYYLSAHRLLPPRTDSKLVHVYFKSEMFSTRVEVVLVWRHYEKNWYGSNRQVLIENSVLVPSLELSQVLRPTESVFVLHQNSRKLNLNLWPHYEWNQDTQSVDLNSLEIHGYQDLLFDDVR